MINLLRRWLFNRNRFIYRYWNGQRIVVGDPMVLWRSLQANENYREDDLKLLTVEDLRLKVIERLAGVVKDVFTIPPVDQGGLTELECIEELARFLDYSGVQKKSTGLMQTSPQSMESNVSDESVTNSDTDSI